MKASFLPNSVGRVVACIAGFAFLFISTASETRAGGINGRYKFTGASGRIVVGDHPGIRVPPPLVSMFVSRNGGKYAVVKGGRLRMYWGSSPTILSLPPIYSGPLSMDSKVSSPSWIRMKKTGKSHTGVVGKAVKMSVTGDADGKAFKGNLVFKLKPQIKAKKLTVKIPVSGRILGKKIRGTLKITAEKN